MEGSPVCANVTVGKTTQAQAAASPWARAEAVRPARLSAAPALLTMALAGDFSPGLSSMSASVPAKVALSRAGDGKPEGCSGFPVRRILPPYAIQNVFDTPRK